MQRRARWGGHKTFNLGMMGSIPIRCTKNNYTEYYNARNHDKPAYDLGEITFVESSSKVIDNAIPQIINCAR